MGQMFKQRSVMINIRSPYTQEYDSLKIAAPKELFIGENDDAIARTKMIQAATNQSSCHSPHTYLIYY